MKAFLSFFLLVLLLSPAAAEEKRYSMPLDGSPTLGRADAPVTIVEFIDFQ